MIFFTNRQASAWRIIIGCVMCFGAGTASAVEYSFSHRGEVGVGDRLHIDVMVNTKGDTINAIEGDINLYGDAASIVTVYNGGSIVSYWMEEAVRTGNSISFAGIIPGGFSGTGLLMTLVVEGGEVGIASIDARAMRTLRHDGYGTEIGSNVVPTNIAVIENATHVAIDDIDVDPPEWLELAIVQADDMFDGQATLIFAADDTGHGISHYEVQESKTGRLGNDNWSVAESPYIIQDQTLSSTFFVKAIDAAGNVRIVAISESKFERFVWLYWILPLAAVVVCILLIMAHRRHIRKNATLSVYDRREW